MLGNTVNRNVTRMHEKRLTSSQVTSNLKKKVSALSTLSPSFTFSVLVQRRYARLNTDGKIGERPCFVNTDTWASVTITRTGITAGLLERESSPR